jgi:transcriptional regulator with XRE-family HTH domain
MSSDAGQIETEDAEARLLAALGRRIRERRQELGISGRRLSQLADVTPSFVSQIELGQAKPSISTLFRITQALDIEIADLFDARPPETGHVLRPEDWSIVKMPTAVAEDAFLSTDPLRRLQVQYSRFPPGVASGDEGVSADAEIEFIFVLSGSVELRVADRRHVLDERCCITFDGRLPHFWSNPNSEPAEILAVLRREVP